MPAIIRLPITVNSEKVESIILMVQTEDGTYSIGNTDEPEQVDENTVSVNIN